VDEVEERMTTGLLIIDMQVGSFGPGSNRFDADGLVMRLNAMSGRIRDGGGVVIFIQHDGPPDDDHHPGKPGWDILPSLVRRPEDVVVHKTSCDVFLDTELDTVLEANGIDELVVTGCATEFCVDTTIRSALGRGYRTLVPEDGHTTADRPHLDAESIITHHNTTWSDFIAPRGPAIPVTCRDIG